MSFGEFESRNFKSLDSTIGLPALARVEEAEQIRQNLLASSDLLAAISEKIEARPEEWYIPVLPLDAKRLQRVGDVLVTGWHWDLPLRYPIFYILVE